MGIRNIKKQITKNLLRFPKEMYSDTLGSLGIVGWMFSTEKPTVKQMKSKWKEILHCTEMPVTFDSPDFIEKGLAFFGMKVPEVFPVAFVQSDWNAVFAPFYNGEVLPNREDGFVIQTLRKGKIYPLNMEKDSNVDLGRDSTEHTSDK